MEDPTTPWFVADVMNSPQRPLMAVSVAAFGVVAVVVGALVFGNGDERVRVDGTREIPTEQSAP